MKLSYSTKGWGHRSWQEYCQFALEAGFSAIEFEYAEQEAGALLANHREADLFLRRLNEHNLAIATIASDLELVEDGGISRAAETIRLASLLSTPYVVLCADFSGTAEEAVVHQALQALLPQAEAANIILLIETSGIYADTKRLTALLDSFASDYLAAVWDVHHTYRYAEETAEDTIRNLGAYVRHVHVHDSLRKEGEEERFCLTGEGDIPFGEILLALRSIDYKAYLSFFCPRNTLDLREPDIVLPHYVNYMSLLLGERQHHGHLYYDKRHEGQFIWKKDKLIDLTFSQVLDKLAETFPDQYAFRYTTLDYTRTYAEFRDDVDEFACALIALGVRSGDKVAVWATNVPQWYIAFWAAVKIGAVLVTVNTAYKITEAEYLLRQSDTHTLVMVDGYKDSDYVGIIKRLCPELAETPVSQPLHCRRLPFLRHVITISSRQEGCLTWEDALAYASRVPVEEVNRRAAQVHPEDVCNMQYTSGTTGFPKGVMLTHRNIVNNGKCIGDRMDLSTADRVMIQVPMFHCFGMVLAMTAAMTHSATLSPLPYFSPQPALACINQEKITCFHGVPTMFIAMLQNEDFPKTDFSHMRTGIMAGSPCPIAVMQSVVDKMNMNEITIVFGQTEASPGCTMSSTDDPLEVRVSTVGRPLPEIECKIVDPETGEDLPDGVNGEFVARGYNLMKGYYKMPRATATAIDSEGWLHTGDMACRTPEGNYRITGRLKDMIIRGGENIYPKEIEDFIYTHPKVQDVQVIGVPSKAYGEEICACVILKEGEDMTEQELKDFVNENMAKHKVPRYVDFVDSFPMNAAGKILKYKMRETAVEKHQLQADASVETA